jgi:hypothetical protein
MHDLCMCVYTVYRAYVCLYGWMYECMHGYSHVEGKVITVLCSVKHNGMKAHGEDTDPSECSASHLDRFTYVEGATSTQLVGGWVTPKPVRTLWRRENLFLCWESNPIPHSSIPQPSHYTD